MATMRPWRASTAWLPDATCGLRSGSSAIRRMAAIASSGPSTAREKPEPDVMRPAYSSRGRSVLRPSLDKTLAPAYDPLVIDTNPIVRALDDAGYRLTSPRLAL